jgi:molybdate transport system permease protein
MMCALLAVEPATLFLGLSNDDWRAVGLSVRVAVLAVMISLPFGIALGWLLARKDFHGKSLVETLVNLPLVLPPVVTGYLLLLLLGKRGPIGSKLYRWLGLEIALTWRAAVIAVAVMGFPLLVRAIRLAFGGIDHRLYQVARSLGAGPFDAFFTVSLPLARSGVLAGVVLAFARGLGEFGATLIFAGNQEETRTMAIEVYTLNSLPDPSYEYRMWGLVVVSIVLAAMALAGSEYLERRGQRRESA